MVDLLTRIKTESANVVRRLRVAPGSFRFYGKPTSSLGYGAGSLRGDPWRMRELMLSGEVYQPRLRGGALEDVYWLLQRVPDKLPFPPIVGYFNPVRPIVDFYSNALGGRLGVDITIADDVKDEEDIHPDLKGLIGLVWRWSNLDMRLAEFTTLAANQGTVGIRVISDDETGRVFLDFDSRQLIRHIERDTRGNVITVILRYEYDQYGVNGEVIGRMQVDEVISKYGFSLKVGGVEQLKPEQQRNDLGFCPYVLVKHLPVPGSVWGAHAYEGSEQVIHAINHAASQLDESDLAHIWPTWFLTSPAQGTPAKINMGRNRIVYAQTRAGDPAPTMDSMTPDMDKGGTVNYIDQRIGWLENRQPQLAYSNLQLLSGISGETLANVMLVAQAESMRARYIYEDGIKRAVQMAISVGIAHGLKGFDLGTGTGTADAAERAFDGGDGPEAFAFADRPPLPQTTYQKVQEAQASQANAMAKANLANALPKPVSDNERLRTAGFDDERIKLNKEEKSKQDTMDTEEDDDA